MILVTGATGFIGGYVLRALLDSGHEVVGTSRYSYRPETQYILGNSMRNVPLVRADVRNLGLLRTIFADFKPDCVVHLDAYVSPVELKTDPLRAVEYNFVETMNVLELAREFGTGRVVFASSIAVLPSIRYLPIDANHPIITATEGPGGGFYGASKAASEIFGLTYADSFDLDFRVVRPSAVYGFGMQWPIGVKPVIEGLVRGEAVEVAGHAPLRDYTPVEDVAAVFAAICDCEPGCDKVFYAGTGQELSTSAEYYAAVRSVFPEGSIILSGANLDPTGVESRYRGRIDMTPAHAQLGLQPRYSSLVEGLTAYANTYRAFIS